MMQNALSNSIRQLEQVLGRELTSLLSRFQTPEGGAGPEAWGGYAEKYAHWAQTTPFPRLVRRLLFYSVGPAGATQLWELPLGGSPPRLTGWNGETEEIRDHLDTLAREPPRRRGLRVFLWMLFPSARALVRREPDIRVPPPGPDRRSELKWGGFVILVLDWRYVSDTLLPEVVGRLFCGPDGELLYQVALVRELYI